MSLQRQKKRRVFISFLGPTSYEEVCYRFAGEEAREVQTPYVSEAILALLPGQWKDEKWTADDRWLFFLTPEAEANNWTPSSKEGLLSRLKALREPAQIRAVSITPGYTSSQIWSVFQKIFDQLEAGDVLYFDITHSFRSLPMLMMVLINYAKELKDVRVGGIYYGAFEALGPLRKVRELPVAERKVDIIELTLYSDIQDWTGSTRQFLRTGDAAWLSRVLRRVRGRRFQQQQGFPYHKELEEIAKYLRVLTNNIRTCRGNAIIENEAGYRINQALSKILDAPSQLPELFTPLLLLLEKLAEKMQPFREKDSVWNGYAAVQFCIDHNLIQQGLTLLRETLITHICQEMEANHFDRTVRETVARVINYYLPQREPIPEQVEGEEASVSLRDLERSETFQRLRQAGQSSRLLSMLVNARNDINHAGVKRDAVDASTLGKNLKEVYHGLMKIIEAKG